LCLDGWKEGYLLSPPVTEPRVLSHMCPIKVELKVMSDRRKPDVCMRMCIHIVPNVSIKWVQLRVLCTDLSIANNSCILVIFTRT
jgi:hypothetical protein